MIERLTNSGGRKGVFDDDALVIQKYLERPITFKGKLVKVRMVCVITC